MTQGLINRITGIGIAIGTLTLVLLLAGIGGDLLTKKPLPDSVSPYASTPVSQPAGSAILAISQVDFSEGIVEIVNLGTEDGTLSGYWLCNYPHYAAISGVVPASGSISLPFKVDSSDGEVGMYSSNDFASPDAIVSYVEWGDGSHKRSQIAVKAGIWDGAPVTAGEARLTATTGQPSSSADWSTE